MKRNQIKSLALIALMLFTNNLMAQSEAISAVENFEKEWLLPLFVVIAGIATIIGGFKNMTLFFGEKQDIKQGFINVIIWPGAVALIVGVYLGVKEIAGGLG